MSKSQNCHMDLFVKRGLSHCKRLARFIIFCLSVSLFLLPFQVLADTTISREPLPEKIILLTFAGDCTLGSEEHTRNNENSFDSVVAREGYDYPFARFLSLFQDDDWTIVNLEGVLSNSMSGENKSKYFRFRGPTVFTDILKRSSVEAVSLANNHVGDYGARGLTATQEALTEYGIEWFRTTKVAFLEKDGIRIAFLAADPGTYDYLDEIKGLISSIKRNGEASAVVVCWHAGTEYDAHHNESQERMAKNFFLSGADLVIMTHAHVVQGFDQFGSGAVFYSLGNFVFGGNCEIREEPYRSWTVTALYTLVVQSEMHFSENGRFLGQELIIYPSFTSSDAPHNNYQPFPVGRAEAEQVMQAVQFDSRLELPPLTEENGYWVVRIPFLSVDPAEYEVVE